MLTSLSPRPSSSPRRRPIAAIVAAVAVGSLAACTASAPSAPSATPSSGDSAAVTVENCDTRVSFDSAPERVVTIKSSTTEMLLALGLGERIVGTAFQDGPVPTEWAESGSALTSLSPQMPSEEVVLEREPDLVYAGWESNFSADGAGTRSDLETLGVSTYVSPAACRSDRQPTRLSFDDVFDEIDEVATIFRVDGSELVSAQRKALGAIEPTGDDRTAFWYSSGDDTPYAGGGIGAPQMVLDAAGLTNIAADVDASWAPFTWESVIAADPYFLVLVDATWNTVDSKIAALESNPATANLDAVRHKRYLTVDFAASEAGVRSVETASSFADQVRAIDRRENDAR